ncbi:MAG: AsmA family protein [Candidatus Nitricoxidivorans perseverans]|uniref:AsmA family protein n=1 Tax=Candidatus Nitricoxidivorans perseverans TaxID=2975601 RepID=A0AA49FJ85_9PROT|nr:MAG: AsmA family protein [Candidatus Nitricoxidivorans perseverans]
MKALKTAGVVLAVLLALVLAAVAVVMSRFDAGFIKAEAAKAVQEKKQRTLRIDGPLELSFWPNLGVRVGRLSLSEHKSDREFLALESARVSVAVMPLLDRQVVVDTIEISGAQATIVRRRDGTLNIDDLLSKDEDKSPMVKFDIAGIRVDGSRLAFRDEQGRRDIALSGLSLRTGRVANAAEGPLELAAKVTSNNPRSAVDIKIAARYRFDLDAKDIALSKLDAAIEGELAGMRRLKLPVTGSLRANWGKQTADAQIEARLDESRIEAKVRLAKFSPPDIGFDIDVDKIDVDKYLPPAAKDSAGGEGKAGAGGTAERKIDLSPLKSLNLHGTVKAGQLQVAGVKATNAKLRIDAAGGKLNVAPHSMNLYEGTLNGTLSVNADGNAIALKQNLAGVNINPLMRDALDKDLVEGRGSVALDLGTRGDTVAAMRKALSGTASLSLRDGAIKGIDLAKSFRGLKTKLSSRQDVVQAASRTEKTDFAELSGSFKIAGGVAHNDDLTAKSPFLRLAGAGDIDIGNGGMNYLLKTSVVNTAGGQDAPGLEHLKGITVPVRLAGPFENLSWKLELASLVQEAVKAKVGEKRQEVREKARDKLFKGLLGR